MESFIRDSLVGEDYNLTIPTKVLYSLQERTGCELIVFRAIVKLAYLLVFIGFIRDRENIGKSQIWKSSMFIHPLVKK